MLPSFMVKLFWDKMAEVAEGVGMGEGVEHEGGGERAARVVVEYSYEDEEEIEEDTSRQAQHGVSGPGGHANEREGPSSESSSGSSSSDESDEHDGEGAGEHPGGTERTEEHGVALGERVDERVNIEQQATGDDGAVEEQEGGAAAQEGGAGMQPQEGGAAVHDFGTGVQQQVGGAAAQVGGAGGQQQEGVAVAQEGGAGVQQQEGVAAAQECRPGQVAVRWRHRTASGSGQAGPSTGLPSTAGQSTSAVASGGQVVELLQRVAELEASQKKLVADVFAKHIEQAAVFNKLAGDFRAAWNTISEASKSTLKQCDDAVNGVTEERKLLEGARTKLDEMSGKIMEGVAAAIAKASEDAVEKQLKLVEERMVASVVQGIEKAVKEDLFYSAIPPESMKVMKDVVKEGYKEAEAGRLEVLTEAMARGFRGSAGPSTRSRQEEGVAGVRSGGERRVHERSIPPSSSVGGHVGSPVASPPSRARHPVGKSVEDNEVIVLDQSPLQKTSEATAKPPPDAFAPLRDMLSGLGKKGEKGLVAGEKSGGPIESVASAGKGAVGYRGAPTPSGSAAGKAAGEAWGAPSQVVVAGGLLSKTTADSAAQVGVPGRPVEPVGKKAYFSALPAAHVAAPVLGTVRLSEPRSPPLGPAPASKKRQAGTKPSKRAAEATESGDPVEMGSLLGQAPVETASTVVAARHEKAKKQKVLDYAPPPPPDDQGKTYRAKAPFKGPGMMVRKGKFVSEQTVGGRKRFLGTFETEADQKFCTAICWRVYFPDIDLQKYDKFTAEDEQQWKVYLDAAAGMATGVWSVAQEQGECRFEEKLSKEDIQKDALAAANAALFAPETAKRANVAAIAALVSVILHVGKMVPAKQWPDLLYSTAVQGLGSTDPILLQMVRVAAQVCTQWCCCRFAAHLLEDAGYGSLAMPEEKSKAKQGEEDATEEGTGE
ncbi:unnamed protein product [Closterium sp. Naga37s-1]|nr:unnamed protein product [Closterium sp. Naga37s-1]